MAWYGRLYGPHTVKSMASVFFKILHLVRELHTFQLRIVSHDCRYLPSFQNTCQSGVRGHVRVCAACTETFAFFNLQRDLVYELLILESNTRADQINLLESVNSHNFRILKQTLKSSQTYVNRSSFYFL